MVTLTPRAEIVIDSPSNAGPRLATKLLISRLKNDLILLPIWISKFADTSTEQFSKDRISPDLASDLMEDLPNSSLLILILQKEF